MNLKSEKGTPSSGSRMRPEEMVPTSVAFQADVSADVEYGVETASDGFVVEVSPTGIYVSYRIE